MPYLFNLSADRIRPVKVTENARSQKGARGGGTGKQWDEHGRAGRDTNGTNMGEPLPLAMIYKCLYLNSVDVNNKYKAIVSFF